MHEGTLSSGRRYYRYLLLLLLLLLLLRLVPLGSGSCACHGHTTLWVQWPFLDEFFGGDELMNNERKLAVRSKVVLWRDCNYYFAATAAAAATMTTTTTTFTAVVVTSTASFSPLDVAVIYHTPLSMWTN